MTVTIVVAIGANGVIGANGGMPWPRTGDQVQFKALTMGHPIVMGRATYDSIGRPLPGRTTIVVTRQPYWAADGVLVAGGVSEAIAEAEGLDDEVFLIGGAQVYAEALANGLVDRMVVTRVDLAPAGDTYFPDLDWDDWIETSRELHADSVPGYVIATYDKRD
ncbi:MAG: dihydrofolate reductase [Nocardioidaceae bacterium]|nr:dihydrofolate reductase [Nocardioidaceae bacterium]